MMPMLRISTSRSDHGITLWFASRLFVLTCLFHLTLAYAHLFGKPPQAVIHLPQNVFKGKDGLHINHRALSEYLSNLKIQDTLHEHGRLLAQLDHAQLAQHLGQTINAGQLPLISVTEAQDQPAKVSYEVHSTSGDNGNAAYQVEPAAPSMMNDAYGGSSGYQQKPIEQQQTGGGDYATGGGDAYASPEKGADNSYSEKQSGEYGPQTDTNTYAAEGPVQTYEESPSSTGYGGQPQQQQQQQGGYNNNAAPSAEQYGSGGYADGQQSGGNYDKQMSGYELMSAGPEGAGGYSQSDYSQNYISDNSPFDIHFVQDILNRVLQQLEQQQITPEQLQAYGEPEDDEPQNDNQMSGGDYSAGGEYSSTPSKQPQQGGYSSSSSSPSYQTVAASASSYGQRKQLHPSSYQSQAGYAMNKKSQQAPAAAAHQTITYRMPTISYEMPAHQIDQLMQALSNGGSIYGSSSQQIPMIFGSGNQLRLPSSLGKIRTIAVIKSNRLPTIKHLPAQLAALAQESNSQKALRYTALPSTLSAKKLVRSLVSSSNSAAAASSSSQPAKPKPNYRMPFRKSLLATPISSSSNLKHKKPCDQDKKAKK